MLILQNVKCVYLNSFTAPRVNLESIVYCSKYGTVYYAVQGWF